MSGFNKDLFYYIGSSTISVNVMKFPGGEVGVSVNQPNHPEYHSFAYGEIYATIRSSDDLMALLLATDALKRAYVGTKWTLNLPYVPYARQDRVCNPGEALSIKVMADLINAQGYSKVRILDPHSAVTPALINNCVVIDQSVIFARAEVKLDWSDITIVAPDQGATKKCEEFAKRVGALEVITCQKTRELSTGKIESITFSGNPVFDNKRVVVLDDICDGGRTFIELANLIEQHTIEFTPARMELMVTHGIFSKGVDVLTPYYDMIYTTDSFCDKEHPKLKVIEF